MILILEEIIFISKGQVRCIQTLTVQIEGLSLVEVFLVFYR
jgi:hypothetical protein